MVSSMVVGIASTSMGTSQWSLSSRTTVFGVPLNLARKKRIGVTGGSRPIGSVCIRASQKINNSGDGDNGGDFGGSISRRALVAFLALSVHLGAGASARADNGEYILGHDLNWRNLKSDIWYVKC